MLEELIKIDKELFLYLNGLGTPVWDGFWVYLSRTLSFITIPIYSLLLFYTYRTFGLKNTAYILAALILLLLGTEQLSIIFKNSVARLRPCHDDAIRDLVRNVKNHCGGKFGYFSAHAANSSALASYFSVVFFRKNKLVLFLLAPWSLLVCYSRIYLGVHFPLDVLTGLSFGVFFGWLFATLVQKLKIFKNV
ncbi:phosphatase PAP2 family protein [Cellulophaga sp. L1A9]|uniref:phosphatase PAP2 family protein n=1 Tax=Cellulophaga sp. L1A9 TaxID=2686362 RepID=UPI00131E5B60|nr:phosphatase PAP2 family protein [Cellulophaga sp. L1A9]